MSEDGHPIVFFDGVCNLCNQSVDFIIARDPDHHFRFASLQSKVARELLADRVDLDDLNTIYLLENGRLHSRSTAALRIARRLRFPWYLLSVFQIVPRFLRDPVYRWIAANRYRWFGKKESCRLPTPEERELFLDAG